LCKVLIFSYLNGVLDRPLDAPTQRSMEA
jgi:hypothetical protein